MRTKVRDNIELDLLCHNQPENAPVMQEMNWSWKRSNFAALYFGWE